MTTADFTAGCSIKKMDNSNRMQLVKKSYEQMSLLEQTEEISTLTTLMLIYDAKDVRNRDIVEHCNESWDKMLKLRWYKDGPEFASLSNLVVKKYPTLIENTVFKSVMVHLENKEESDSIDSYLLTCWPTISPLTFQAVASILNAIFLTSRCQKILNIIIKFVEAAKYHTSECGEFWKMYPSNYRFLVKSLLLYDENCVKESMDSSERLKCVIENEIKLLISLGFNVDLILQHFPRWKDLNS